MLRTEWCVIHAMESWCLRPRQVHEAKELVYRMEKFGIKPDYKIYLPILLAQQSRHNFPAIRRTLDEMKDRDIQPDKRVRTLKD